MKPLYTLRKSNILIYLCIKYTCSSILQASLELVKVVKGVDLDQYKNTFLNLALPVFVLSEPGLAKKEVMKYVHTELYLTYFII